MNVKILGAGLALLLLGILSVATSSIALECYNQNDKPKEHNYNFTIATLVSGIVAILSGIVSMGVLARSP